MSNVSGKELAISLLKDYTSAVVVTLATIAMAFGIMPTAEGQRSFYIASGLMFLAVVLARWEGRRSK